MENVNYIKERIDKLYDELSKSAATFTYKPHEIEKIKRNIYNLQDCCKHEFVNGICKYCRKEKQNVN